MTALGLRSTSQIHLLIADTEQMLCELLQIKFEDEGYRVDIISDGQLALQRDLTVYSLILVDLMDRPFDGLQFTAALKGNPDTAGIPVIIMSRQRTVDDVVNALDMGADDFIPKPLSARELSARMRSVLRRRRITNGAPIHTVLSYRGLRLDLEGGTTTIDDEIISLTRTEFLILALLMRHTGTFYDRASIQREAWENEGSVSDRAIDTNISRLRKKLGHYGRNIVNRHGYGYGFVE